MRKLILFFLLIYIYKPSAYSQISWTQYSGPYGGEVTSFANFENAIFATSSGVTFKSLDNGNSWTPAFPDWQIHKLFSTNSALLLGGPGLIYEHTSSEKNLEQLGNDISGVNWIYEFNGNLFVSADNGVYKYSSLQKKWLPKNDGLETSHLSMYWIKSMTSVDDVLFCSSSLTGIYKSNDAGENWEKVDINDEGSYEFLNHNNTLYAQGFSSEYFFKSIDKGLTWSGMRFDLPNIRINDLAIKEDLLIISTENGVYELDETASHWNLISTKIFEHLHIKDKIILASNAAGVYKWDLEAEDFLLSNRGINTAYTLDINVFNKKVYAATLGGVYFTPEGQDNWKFVPELEGVYSTSFAKIDQVLLVGTNKGLFKTTSTQLDWEEIDLGLTKKTIWKLSSEGNNFYAATDEGVFVSYNKGQSWKHLPNTLNYNQAISLGVNPKMLIASDTRNLYTILPDSSDWVKFDFFNDKDVFAISLVDEVIFVTVSNDFMYRSIDYGKTWQKTSLWSQTFLHMGTRGKYIYTIIQNLILFSPDKGKTWEYWPDIEAPLATLTCIAEGENRFYIGTYGKSIWHRPFNTSTLLSSGVYEIEENLIYDIADKTTLDDFRSNIQLTYGAFIEHIVGEGLTDRTAGSEYIQIGDVIRVIAEDKVNKRDLVVAKKNLITSVNDFTDRGYRVYPIPASEKLYIENSGKIRSYQVKNLQGKTILQPSTKGAEIDIAPLPKGLYILVIEFESQKREVVKFIKE